MIASFKPLSLPTRGSRHPLLRFYADQGPVSVVDRLKTTESISQGARAFALSQTPRIEPACVKQLSRSIITTKQASLILLSVVLSATQGRE